MSEAAPVGLVSAELEQVTHRAYVVMLRRRRWSVEDLAREVGTSPETAQRAADLLISRLQAVQSAPGVYEAQAPDVALRRLAAGHEQMAMRARSMVPTLTGIYEQARRPRAADSEHEEPIVRQLAPGREAVEVIESMYQTTDSELYSMWRYGETAIAMDARTRETEGFRGMAPTVMHHLIVEASHSEGTRAASRRFGWQANSRIRQVARAPISAVVADRHSAFVEMSSGHEEPGGVYAFVTQDAAIVGGVLRVVEALWESGGAMYVSEPSVDGNAIDQRVLALLAGGASDRTIARQLDVSLRTVERRVRRILEELSAPTRFAAGCEAVRRGWL